MPPTMRGRDPKIPPPFSFPADPGGSGLGQASNGNLYVDIGAADWPPVAPKL